MRKKPWLKQKQRLEFNNFLASTVTYVYECDCTILPVESTVRVFQEDLTNFMQRERLHYVRLK
jgi:hypothetical protein